jgi:hypothetical protein
MKVNRYLRMKERNQQYHQNSSSSQANAVMIDEDF